MIWTESQTASLGLLLQKWMVHNRSIPPSQEVHGVDVFVSRDLILFLQQLFGVPVRSNKFPFQELGLITRNPVEEVATQRG